MKEVTFICYDEERDGLIQDYLEVCEEVGCMPLFRGYERYEQLWDIGYLVSSKTNLRIRNGLGIDEVFLVLNRDKVKRITSVDEILFDTDLSKVRENYELIRGTERQKVFDAGEVLKDSFWRVSCLNMEPVPRRV